MNEHHIPEWRSARDVIGDLELLTQEDWIHLHLLPFGPRRLVDVAGRNRRH